MSTGGLTPESALAVHNALAAYAHALSDAKADFSALFGADGKLELGAETVSGAEALGAAHGRLQKQVGARGVHIESNVMLGHSGSWFTNCSTWQHVRNGRVISYGTHEDLLKVTDGKAHFVSRKVVKVFPNKAKAAKGGKQPEQAEGAAEDGAPAAKKGAKANQGKKAAGGKKAAADKAAGGEKAPAAGEGKAKKAAGKKAAGKKGKQHAAATFDCAKSLFVAQVPPAETTSERDGAVRAAFGAFGAIARVVLRGKVAFVEYETAEAADKALAADKVEVLGAPVVVQRKKAAPSGDSEPKAAEPKAAEAKADAKE